MEKATLPVHSPTRRGLSSTALKYIAIAAMLIDHIAWCFVDTYSAVGQLMHIIGRITAPVMCFFIAEGYNHTRNVKKYLLRLGIFALISWFPFVYMETGQLPVIDGIVLAQSMIYTLFLALLALIVRHSERIDSPTKAALILLITLLSVIGDWMVLAIVWTLLFDKYHNDFKKQAAAFSISSVVIITVFTLINGNFTKQLFQFGVLLALIPLYFYNGERGSGGSFNKWVFYIFYPLHMLVLGIIAH